MGGTLDRLGDSNDMIIIESSSWRRKGFIFFFIFLFHFLLWGYLFVGFCERGCDSWAGVND